MHFFADLLDGVVEVEVEVAAYVFDEVASELEGWGFGFDVVGGGVDEADEAFTGGFYFVPGGGTDVELHGEVVVELAADDFEQVALELEGGEIVALFAQDEGLGVEAFHEQDEALVGLHAQAHEFGAFFDAEFVLAAFLLLAHKEVHDDKGDEAGQYGGQKDGPGFHVLCVKCFSGGFGGVFFVLWVLGFVLCELL